MLICPTAGLVETNHSHYLQSLLHYLLLKCFARLLPTPSVLQLLVNSIQEGTHIFEMAKFSNDFYLGDLCKL